MVSSVQWSTDCNDTADDPLSLFRTFLYHFTVMMRQKVHVLIELTYGVILRTDCRGPLMFYQLRIAGKSKACRLKYRLRSGYLCYS